MTARLPFQLEIPRRSNICAKGNETFTSKQKYYSLIFEDSDEKLCRNDYCESCWELIRHQTDLKIKTFWKSQIPEKKPQSMRAINRDELALELFKEALGKNSDDDAAEAFVLALYLARRKLIAFRQQISREDGISVHLYEINDTEEMVCVRPVALSQLQTDVLQKCIAEKLKSCKV